MFATPKTISTQSSKASLLPQLRASCLRDSMALCVCVCLWAEMLKIPSSPIASYAAVNVDKQARPRTAPEAESIGGGKQTAQEPRRRILKIRVAPNTNLPDLWYPPTTAPERPKLVVLCWREIRESSRSRKKLIPASFYHIFARATPGIMDGRSVRVRKVWP